jgi:hypothetical protein
VTAVQTEAYFAGHGPVTFDRHALAYHRSIRALEDLVDSALEVLAPDRHRRPDPVSASMTVGARGRAWVVGCDAVGGHGSKMPDEATRRLHQEGVSHGKAGAHAAEPDQGPQLTSAT